MSKSVFDLQGALTLALGLLGFLGLLVINRHCALALVNHTAIKSSSKSWSKLVNVAVATYCNIFLAL